MLRFIPWHLIALDRLITVTYQGWRRLIYWLVHSTAHIHIVNMFRGAILRYFLYPLWTIVHIHIAILLYFDLLKF